jgi:hypothetical protein
MSREALIEQLSEKAGIKGRAEGLDALRQDFATVWAARRAYGYISERELVEGRFQAGDEIKEKAGDAEWMAEVTQQYAEAADMIRRDKERRDRIAQEVRASRV